MEKSPENKERPNKSELKPTPKPSEKTVRGLGGAAIHGARQGK